MLKHTLTSHPAMARHDSVLYINNAYLAALWLFGVGFSHRLQAMQDWYVGFALHSLLVRCLDLATGEAAPHTHRSRGAVGGGPNARMSNCRNL